MFLGLVPAVTVVLLRHGAQGATDRFRSLLVEITGDPNVRVEVSPLPTRPPAPSEEDDVHLYHVSTATCPP
jgi:hypothetical protein